MKNKFFSCLSIILSAPGLAWAEDPDWISKNNQLFFYGMVGFGALAVLLIIWEIIYQISSAKSSNTGAVMKVVTETPEEPEEENDPIKALLTEQIRGGVKSEEELPSFLREDTSAGKQAESSSEGDNADDPFRKLLQKSAQKTEEPKDESAQAARRMILPPIKPKTAGESPEASKEEDPFKKLLISSKEKEAKSEDKPEILSDDSDMELLIGNEPEMVAPPAEDKPKKLAFRMGTGAAKPTGAEKLFDRISDAKTQPASDTPQAEQAPRRLGIGIRRAPVSAGAPQEAPPETPEEDDGAKPGKRLELKFKPRSKE